MKNKLLATVAVAAVVGFGGFAAAQSQMGGEFEQSHIWRDAGEKRRQHERSAIGQQDAQPVESSRAIRPKTNPRKRRAARTTSGSAKAAMKSKKR